MKKTNLHLETKLVLEMATHRVEQILNAYGRTEAPGYDFCSGVLSGLNIYEKIIQEVIEEIEAGVKLARPVRKNRFESRMEGRSVEVSAIPY